MLIYKKSCVILNSFLFVKNYFRHKILFSLEYIGKECYVEMCGFGNIALLVKCILYTLFHNVNLIIYLQDSKIFYHEEKVIFYGVSFIATKKKKNISRKYTKNIFFKMSVIVEYHFQKKIRCSSYILCKVSDKYKCGVLLINIKVTRRCPLF